MKLLAVGFIPGIERVPAAKASRKAYREHDHLCHLEGTPQRDADQMRTNARLRQSGERLSILDVTVQAVAASILGRARKCPKSMSTGKNLQTSLTQTKKRL